MFESTICSESVIWDIQNLLYLESLLCRYNLFYLDSLAGRLDIDVMQLKQSAAKVHSLIDKVINQSTC